MGRPKKSDLKCTVCNATFMLKSRLLTHMKSHSGDVKSKEAKTSSNWCYVCKKNFKDSEYKLHIQRAHQCVLLTTKKIKKEVDELSEESPKEKVLNFRNIISDIKIEPIEISIDEEYNAVSKKMPVPKKGLLYRCRVCGVRCKGQRGLKYHRCMPHKLQRKYSSDTSHSKSELEVNEEQSQIKSTQKYDEHPILLPNNGLINLDLNAQPGLLSEGFPLTNALTIGNQTNVELLSATCNQNAKILEVIPKFEYNSESYMKWLKKFIEKCKAQKYPLPQVMCENINYVLAEMSHAVGNPIGSLRKKSNHYFVMRMYKILSEVMMGHMRYSLSVVIR